MCKFSTEDDSGYFDVWKAICEVIADTPETLDERPALRLQPILSEASHTRSGVHDTTALPNAYPPSLSKFTPPPTGSPYSIPVRGSKSPAPPLPRRQDKYPLDRPTYQRLLNTALAIEGPCPPEKFHTVINHYKALNQWGSQLEDYKVVFLPDTFDSQSMKSLSELLFLAACAGDVTVVRATTHAKADVDYFVPELGDCPLNAALVLDNTDVIEALLEAKASVEKMVERVGLNEQQYMANRLPIASPATIRVILKHCGKKTLPPSAVLIAAQSSGTGLLHLLSEKDFDFDFLIRGDGGSTALHLAARHGREENVKYLLSIGFDANSLDTNKRTPLYEAIMNGKLDTLRLLLNHYEPALVNITDAAGSTPVHALASQPRGGDWVSVHSDMITAIEFDILTLLMEGPAGAQLNDRNGKGQTALHLTVEHGLATMAALLLQSGANPNMIDASGLTPLHLCAVGSSHHTQIAVSLIEKGASLKARSPPPQSLTPLEVAKHFANPTMVSMLELARLERGAVKWFAKKVSRQS
ncbi:hypothetical protein LTR10_004224 [Elasticomyces elasticus]|nr:hypothetical protein LTR10_004224 [Elasticomyces elasticus]